MIEVTRDGIIVQPCTKKGYLPWKAAYSGDEHAAYGENKKEAVQALRDWKANGWKD